MGKGVQLTLKELLNDKAYAKWITITPRISVKGASKPWMIYAKKTKKGPWAKSEVATYDQALKWAMKHLDEYYDIVIHSRRQAFRPPLLKKAGVNHFWPTPTGHVWCPYCRRPTLFLNFSSHHAIPKKYPLQSYEKRCSICGIKLQSIRRFDSKLTSSLNALVGAKQAKQAAKKKKKVKNA